MALACLAARPAPAFERWQLRGSGLDAEAVWQATTGDASLRLRCDRGDPRIDLGLRSSELATDLHRLTLVADGTSMDYPLDRTAYGYRARIALDAPILDRMLVAQQFTVLAGGRAVQTGAPGTTLARVVRTCRDHHWPRPARSASRREDRAERRGFGEVIPLPELAAERHQRAALRIGLDALGDDLEPLGA